MGVAQGVNCYREGTNKNFPPKCNKGDSLDRQALEKRGKREENMLVYSESHEVRGKIL